MSAVANAGTRTKEGIGMAKKTLDKQKAELTKTINS
ncbi:hypothetical protein Emin_0944 [Elusimicrobium minutum Pei191]|uniref:Uncharacterized protein n=1 Tax=Elusimicrobium minutum (strain Pei191) TaxID=445932 RepID=B2KDA1_ELUMP|nr:hypothetical protein Emin_0944 [Elusimicrobium minutum Pei191]